MTTSALEAHERLQACWDEINSYIHPGPLDGQASYQRNGMVLAANIVFQHMERARADLDAALKG